MKRQRVYVDTSVFGGCFDREFAEWSVALMNDFRAGRYALVVSDVTASEIDIAPEEVRDLYDELVKSAEELTVDPEALALLRAYETRGVLPPRYRADMPHIALAPVAEVDVLVS